MSLVEELNEEFQLPGVARVVDLSNGYPVIEIDNQYASAAIALHGGQVMRWQPHGQAPVIWLSDKAVYREGKAIRGGVPVCWPWFGPNPIDKGLPAHGFARNLFWRLASIDQLDEGVTEVRLVLVDNDKSQMLWPFAFELELVIEVGEELSVDLYMTNCCDEPCVYTAALHSYLHVGDIRQVEVSGLEQVEYVDKLQGGHVFTQPDAIRFDGELDRIYQMVWADTLVHDPVLERTLRVAKEGSASTVVWNPWLNKSAGMGDFEEEGYLRMLCIEAANCGADIVHLGPGDLHILGTSISIE